jgi:hypothetical protein
MSKWRPIETAPKDEAVLAFWQGGPFFDSDRVVLSFIGAAEWAPHGWHWRGDHLNFGEGEPTHWMPLPKPPK